MTLIRPASAGRFTIERLLRPRSVAVIGADTRMGQTVMTNLITGGFAGPILPVAPSQGAIGGVLTYNSVADLPMAPDLAVLAGDTPAGALFGHLSARGMFAAVALALLPDLTQAAASSGVRVLGPGSFGVAVPSIGLNASLAHLAPMEGRVALVSQSAALCRAVLDWAEPNGVGFSHIVGIGGNADIGFARILDFLSRDPGTGAILLDIRLIKDRRAFLSAARAAARMRPVVAIRAGGRLIDPTGRAEAVFDAALQRAGVLTVSRLEDLLAAAETLTRAKPIRREGLAIVTNATGPARMAADAALASGLALADLAPSTVDVLRMAAAEPPRDGIVYVGVDAPTRLAETAAMLAGAKEVGGLLVVMAPAGANDAAGVEALIACGATVKMPLLVCAMGETTGAAHRRRLAEAGVPAFATPEQAVGGFLHLVRDRRARLAARELPPSTVLSLAPDRALVRRIFAEVRRAGRSALLQDEALDVLSAYGIPTMPGRAAASAIDCAAAAALIGYPVVLKRRRDTRPDESAPGGMVLDIVDLDTLTRATHRLEDGSAPCTFGYLVQRRAGRATELAIRVADDPVFGPALSFGPGGTTAGAITDDAFDLPPLNLPLAHALIARSRAAKSLAARHDRDAADIEAVGDTLVRVSQLLVEFPEIAELDINPLFADANGVAAADAWLRLRAPGETSQLAIPPYPVELSETVQIGGETIEVRPIRPEDAEAHAAMFARLTPEDIRFRFFSAMRALTPEQISRMTQIDYDREMAFVAVRPSTGETVGVSRLVCETGREQGEFAVLVQPDMKGKGLASRLMRRLIDWGRARGLTEIVGQVLADNIPMLSFVHHLGFDVHRLPEEPDVMEARMRLVP